MSKDEILYIDKLHSEYCATQLKFIDDFENEIDRIVSEKGSDSKVQINATSRYCGKTADEIKILLPKYLYGKLNKGIEAWSLRTLLNDYSLRVMEISDIVSSGKSYKDNYPGLVETLDNSSVDHKGRREAVVQVINEVERSGERDVAASVISKRAGVPINWLLYDSPYRELNWKIYKLSQSSILKREDIENIEQEDKKPESKKVEIPKEPSDESSIVSASKAEILEASASTDSELMNSDRAPTIKEIDQFLHRFEDIESTLDKAIEVGEKANKNMLGVSSLIERLTSLEQRYDQKLKEKDGIVSEIDELKDQVSGLEVLYSQIDEGFDRGDLLTEALTKRVDAVETEIRELKVEILSRVKEAINSSDYKKALPTSAVVKYKDGKEPEERIDKNFELKKILLSKMPDFNDLRIHSDAANKEWFELYHRLVDEIM